MADVHIFDVRIAKLYGVNCAVILQNIWHWVQKNEANGTNYYDGAYWTYNSVKAFTLQYPYLSQKQIRTAIQKLCDEGILKTGNYNTAQYDRTLWYSVTEKGKCILLSGQMDLTSEEKRFAPEGEPIPDINTDVNADEKPYAPIIDHLNEKAGTKYRSTSGKTQTLIRARLAEGFALEDFFAVIDGKCAEWLGTEMEKYLRPETLFGTKFEGYLNTCGRKEAKNNGINPIDCKALGEKVGTYL